MQERTSPLKFGHLAEKSGLDSVPNLSAKASATPPAARGPRANRRQALALGLAASAAALPATAQPAQAAFEGADWALWPALPLAPYGKRKTTLREAVPG